MRSIILPTVNRVEVTKIPVVSICISLRSLLFGSTNCTPNAEECDEKEGKCGNGITNLTDEGRLVCCVAYKNEYDN